MFTKDYLFVPRFRIDMELLLKETGWCQLVPAVLVLPRDDRRARRYRTT
jgi:hypothetical protein